MGSSDGMLDGNEDVKLEVSSMGGSPGSYFIIEICYYKGMLVGKEDGKLRGSELGESLGLEG